MIKKSVWQDGPKVEEVRSLDGWAFRGTKGGSWPPILLVLDSSGGLVLRAALVTGQCDGTWGKHQNGPPFPANGQTLLAVAATGKAVSALHRQFGRCGWRRQWLPVQWRPHGTTNGRPLQKFRPIDKHRSLESFGRPIATLANNGRQTTMKTDFRVCCL